MTSSGIDAQIGFVEESAFGTYTVPTRFFEFISESLSLDIERIESQGLRAGRRVSHRWAEGVRRVQGDVEMELVPQDFGLILEHMFGTVNTTGAGPYVHTCSPGPLDGKSLGVQVGRPDISGTVRPFSYLGCKITSWELMAEVNQYAKLRLSLYGVDEDTGQSLASATYDASYSPFVFTHGSLTLAGVGHDVRSIRLSGNNALAIDRHFIRSTDPTLSKEPLEAGIREYSGTLMADFEDLTEYNRFVNGTEAALVLTFNAGASAILTVTANVRFDGETPQVRGAELLEQPLPFMCTSSTSDAAAITAALTNGDSAP